MRRAALAVVMAAGLVAGGCGGSGSGSGGSSGSSATAVNGGTLRAGIPDNPDYLDPGLSYTNEGWEILEATNNGLLTFKKAAGGEGAQIVPDIATAMPAVTDGGKTYTFHVRPNVMFSPPVSRAVKPSDVKFSIERLFRIDSGGLSFFTGIEGANAYAKSRKGGISGIVANDAKGTITFHLTQPDGTFLDYIATPFAFVLPAGTPSKDISTLPQWRIATGPYRVSSYTPKQQLVITRNPNFHQWTSDSPNGHLNQIDVQIGVTPEQSVNEIADGQLDWYFESVPPDRLTQLRAQYPKQVYPFVRNNITYFFMNERKYPFNKLDVRKAVNYAIDRHAMLAAFGVLAGQRDDQFMAPAVPGYKNVSIYPTKAPNDTKAKSLFGKGGSAVVYVRNRPYQIVQGTILQYNLKQIGIDASVQSFPAATFYAKAGTKGEAFDAAIGAWGWDYPDPADFLNVFFDGNNIHDNNNQNLSYFNVASVNKQLEQAAALSGDSRYAAYGNLDVTIARDYAPHANMYHGTLATYLSARMDPSCYVYQPIYARPDLGAMCFK